MGYRFQGEAAAEVAVKVSLRDTHADVAARVSNTSQLSGAIRRDADPEELEAIYARSCLMGEGAASIRPPLLRRRRARRNIIPRLSFLRWRTFESLYEEVW